MAKFNNANNTYQILANVLTGDTISINYVNNTYECLKAVYNTGSNALNVNVLNLTGTTTDLINYYTKTEVDVLLDREQNTGLSYTYAQSNANFTSALTFLTYTGTTVPTNYYNKTQADANFVSGLTLTTSYYTAAKCDLNFLSANTSYYTQAQTDANFMSGNTAVVIAASPTAGDLLYYNGATWSKLGIGTDGQFLTVDAANTALTWTTHP